MAHIPGHPATSSSSGLDPWVGGIGAGLGYLLGSSDSDAPGEGVQLGYQGEIPDYSLVRERVLDASDPSMTPGAMGKRYFSAS